MTRIYRAWSYSKLLWVVAGLGGQTLSGAMEAFGRQKGSATIVERRYSLVN